MNPVFKLNRYLFILQLAAWVSKIHLQLQFCFWVELLFIWLSRWKLICKYWEECIGYLTKHKADAQNTLLVVNIFRFLFSVVSRMRSSVQGMGPWGHGVGAWGLFRIAYNGSHLGLTLIRISDKQAFVVHMFTLALALRCLHYTEGRNKISRNTTFGRCQWMSLRTSAILGGGTPFHNSVLINS